MEKEQFVRLVQARPEETSSAALYYWNLYKRNVDKLFFFKINCAPLAFGYFWLFYRRMYIFGILTYILSWLIDEYYIQYHGIMRGVSSFYTEWTLNVLLAVLVNPLYIWFLERKSQFRSHIGVHVRLFLPILVLLRNTLILLMIQLLGIILSEDRLIHGVYYCVPFILVLFLFQYVYYFVDWVNTRRINQGILA